MGGVIASLIVDVAANTVKLQQDVQKINGLLDGVSKGATVLKDALVKAFTITAIAGTVKQVIDFAGTMVDLSAKTQISTRALQAWSLHFGEAGISIDTVTSAALKLSKAIVGGDKSVVDTLGKMGIAVGDLRKLAPEDQFTKVADAVGMIQDPTEKAFAAMTLFGKGGAELLAGLNGHLGESIDKFEQMGLIVSEDTLQAADAFGDELGILAQQLLAVAANVLGPLMPGLTALAEGLAYVGSIIGDVLVGAVKVLQTVFGTLMARIAEMLAFFADMAQKIPVVGKQLGFLGGAADTLRAFAEGTSEAVGKLWVETDQAGKTATKATPALLGLGGATDDVEKAAKKAAEALRDFKNFIAIREMEDYAAAQKAAAEQIEANVRLEFALNNMYLKNAAALGAYAGNVGLFTEQWVGFGTLAPGTVKNITDSGKALEHEIIDPLKMLEQVLQGVQTDFAQMAVVAVRAFEQIKAALKNSELSKSEKFGAIATVGLGAAASIAGDTKVGGALSGASAGAGIGTMIMPGIGTAIGAGVGAIAGWFTSKSAKNKVNEMRQAMIDAAGGWDELNRSAYHAGMTLERVLNAKNVKEYEAALHDLNNAIAFQDQAMATLRDTAEKYGFTLQELGPKFAAAELDEKAQELYQDFKVLTAAGIDTDVVLGKMAGSVNEFVQNSVAMGIAVPNAMRPMIERMIELGLLTDANGNIITSLEDSGISFALTMSEGFEKLIDEVKKLTDAIARGLGIALDDVANQINNMPDVSVGVGIGGADVQIPDGYQTGINPGAGVGGRGGPTVVHNVIMLDGREIGRNTTEYQEGQYYTRHKTRAA